MDNDATTDGTLGQRTRDWKPSRGQAIALQIAGGLVTVAGFVGYALLAAVRYGADAAIELGPLDLLLGLVATVLVLAVVVVAHEAVHGVAMLGFGVRPTFGFGVAGGVLPYVYATAVGVRFARRPYLVIALAPTVVMNLATAALVWWAPWGGWMAVVAALHLGGCIGDWVLAGVALRQPADSQFEDLKEGVRVHLPTS